MPDPGGLSYLGILDVDRSIVAAQTTVELGMKRRKSFVAGTGLMGATESGQQVTAENIHELPPGSVVRNGDGSRHIHLHDGLWLWCCDHAWTYDRVENLTYRLDKKSVLCHLPV